MFFYWNQLEIFFFNNIFIFQGGTELQDPQKVEKVGETYLPYSVFLEYINGLGTSNFA